MRELMKAISEILKTASAGITVYIFLRKLRKMPKKTEERLWQAVQVTRKSPRKGAFLFNYIIPIILSSSQIIFSGAWGNGAGCTALGHPFTQIKNGAGEPSPCTTCAPSLRRYLSHFLKTFNFINIQRPGMNCMSPLLLVSVKEPMNYDRNP